MVNSWRAFCLLHVVSAIGFCSSAKLWPNDENRLESSSIFAFTSPAVSLAKKSHHKGGHKRSDFRIVNDPPTNPPVSAPGTNNGNIFNVLAFNAVGDGITDDTKAFQATWRAACLSESSVIEVPADYIFVVGQITFKGPCQNNLTFQVDGTIIPPTDLGLWASLPNKVQWIGFYKQIDMTLRGLGVINGIGEVWWSQPCKAARHGKQRCPSPTAVKFYGCINVLVRDITIQDSPQMHLKFDNCQQVHVLNISVLSPALSPNTDGVHLQNTGYAILENLVIAAGDDCVSLQTGTTDVLIRNVVCGPGHGISIGGLGQAKSQACVSNITVRDVLIRDTENGVRIKTWQSSTGGSGIVQHVAFDSITMIDVRNPIVINQFYCDTSKRCDNDTEAVLISDISFHNIQGTYDQLRSHAAIYFACSDTVPCRDIKVDKVELYPAQETFFPSLSYCWNSYGVFDPFSCTPPVCLIDIPHIRNSEEYYC